MPNGTSIKVWDLSVRIFHWLLVILFFGSYFTGEVEGSIHIYAGYGVLGLLLFRVLWGLVGTKYAIFNNFVYGPNTTFKYLASLFSRKPIHYLGHNPLGGWMVVILLVLLSLVTWSGLEVYGAEGHGPLADNGSGRLIRSAQASGGSGSVDITQNSNEEFWEEVHEVLSNIALFLVFVHVGGVLVSSLVHRENLLKAMFTGYKRKPLDSAEDSD